MIKDIKTKISELNIDFDYEAYWEIIYLILLAFFVGMRFLLSTMFTIYWPKYFYRTLTVIGVVLVLLHLMMAKDISKKEIAAMLVVTFVFMMSHYVSGYDFLVDLLILILGAYRVNFRNILKTYIAVWSVLLVVTIIGAMTGLAENLVYYQGEGGERVRMALGICYPTDLAAYVVFLMFAYVCVRDEYITYLEIGVMAALAEAVYYVTDARTDFAVMVALVVVLLVAKRFRTQISRKKFDNGILKLVFIIVPFMVSFLYIKLTSLYIWNAGNIVNTINDILSNRLELGKYAMDVNPITWFGQSITENGLGGNREQPQNYFFIDSSYVSIMMKYGVTMLLFVCIACSYFLKSQFKKKRIMWLTVMILILIQSTLEHHYIQYWYNPFLLYFLTDEKIHNKKNDIHNEKVYVEQLL